MKKETKPSILKYMRDGTTKSLSTGQYADRKRTGKTRKDRARKGQAVQA